MGVARFLFLFLIALLPPPLFCAVNLSVPPNPPLSYQFGTDKAGNTVIVWTISNGTNITLQAALESAPPAPSVPPVYLSQQLTAGPLNFPNDFNLVVDQAGNALVAWRIFNTNTFTYSVQAAYKPAASLFFTSITTLSTTGFNVSATPFAALEAGHAVVAWQIEINNGTSTNTNTVAQAAFMPAGGSWLTPGAPNIQDNTISQIGFDVSSPPQAAVDASGNAAVVWRIYNGRNGLLSSGKSNVVQSSLKKSTVTVTGSIFPQAGDPTIQDNVLSLLGADVIEAPQVGIGSANVTVLWRINTAIAVLVGSTQITQGSIILQAANPTF